MSILAPLYALGLLAISLPLIFHLIQRRPRGQLPFSSLMFLSPSPPRLTRRSRLDNLLLLLLRGLVLLLLAAAFARPLWRAFSLLQLDTPPRRLLVLLDASASMQREGLWDQARARAETLIADLQPTDQLALYTFDTRLRPLVGFDDPRPTEVATRQAALRAALKDVQPSWHATDLDEALIEAAELLQNSAETLIEDGTLPPQLVVITDFQAGSRLDKLNGYQWPKEVRLDLQVVRPIKTTNASLSVLVNSNPEATEAEQLRVRVANAEDSRQQQFRLGWADEEGTLLEGKEYAVQVAPGSSRVVRVDQPDGPAHRLMLIGDDHAFDNVRYVARPAPQEVTVAFLHASEQPPAVSEDTEAARRHLLYYLQRAPLDTGRMRVQVRPQSMALPLPLDPRTIPLVVSGDPLSPESIPRLTTYLEQGGRVLLVLDQDAEQLNKHLPGLRLLLDREDLEIGETPVRDYAMLAEIDFRHPLFVAFADPRFSDFTKIRFWSHRHLSGGPQPPWDVIARFDDQAPALVERRVGQGKLWILASGWQPEQSQLALSTKFVPLLAGMVDPSGGDPLLLTSYDVGQTIPLPQADQGLKIRLPDQTLVDLGANAEVKHEFEQTEQPGIYTALIGKQAQPFAVNLPSQESKTATLDVSQLEQRGIVLGKSESMEQIQDRERQMRDVELEARQKLWRWLIVACLAILLLETVIAGCYARRKEPLPAEA